MMTRPKTKPIIHFEGYTALLNTLRLASAGKESPIFVLDINEIAEEALCFFAAYRNDFLEINLIRRQYNFEFSIDGQTYRPQGRPYLCLVGPGQVQSYRILGDDPESEGFIVYVHLSAFKTLRIDTATLPFFRRTAPGFFELHPEQERALWPLLEAMCSEFRQWNAHTAEILKSYLEILLLKAKTYFGTSGTMCSSRPLDLVQTYQDLVQKEMRHFKTVGHFAKQLHVSPKYLNALCQRVLGTNARQVIHQALVAEAQALLWQSPATISEIAYQLGFEELAHFSRLFKKITGHTPLQYQQQAKSG
ncbi:MAG: hypothetical protein OHK0053_33590 [Microscillaceae bacterium]